MPYPRSVTFQTWRECPRCGILWPINQLSRDSTGGKVCPECYDPPGRDIEMAKLNLRFEELDPEENMEPII